MRGHRADVRVAREGVLALLAWIDGPLTLMVMAFLVLMFPFALHFNRRMHRALRQARDRIGDINGQVEDSLAGIRVVQSFTPVGSAIAA